MRCRKCQVRSDRELCFPQFKFVVESNRKSWKDFGSNPLHHVSALALNTIIIIFFFRKRWKKRRQKTYFSKPKPEKPKLSNVLIPRGWLRKNPERDRQETWFTVPHPVCHQPPPSAQAADQFLVNALAFGSWRQVSAKSQNNDCYWNYW